jgi:hypothetical protein
LDMLIFQGVQSLRIWLYQDISITQDVLKELRTLLTGHLQ